MAIKLRLKDHHVREIGENGGLLSLSHHEHSDHKITYSESDLVYDMSLGIFFDEGDRLPAIRLTGRIVQQMLFEILDNVSKKHLENIVSWANTKIAKETFPE